MAPLPSRAPVERGRPPSAIARLAIAGLLLVVLGCGARPGAAPARETSPSGSEPAGPAAPEAAAPAAPAAADPGAGPRTYYQYVDERGSVRFVATLDEVPEAWRERAGRVELSSPPPTSPVQPRARLARRQAAAAALAERQARSQVVLYYARWCGYCRRAKAYLEERGVAYRLKDVDQPAVMAELQRKTGSRSIPVLEIAGERVRGFDEPRIARLLERL